MLEASLLGVGTVLRLEGIRGQWSNDLRQATNKYPPSILIILVLLVLRLIVFVSLGVMCVVDFFFHSGLIYYFGQWPKTGAPGRFLARNGWAEV